MEKPAQTTRLTISRDFSVPHELIWKAWTNPELMKKWWGPKNFTCPYCEIDLRPGGQYLNCMRSPEGRDYWSTGVYTEIRPNEKFACTDSFADEEGNVVPGSNYGMEDFPLECTIVVTLEQLKGETRMTLEHYGIPEGEMQDQARIGWVESFDKLAAALKKRAQWS